MKAAIYARVSSLNERQSTDRQVIDLHNYAERNNIEVVKVYEEHISGAKRNEERPILCECLDYCISNDLDMLNSVKNYIEVFNKLFKKEK